jgi:hypothetical protein
MLGWHIAVYRQASGGASPARFDSDDGVRLAVWQARLDGLDWIDDLVATGEAFNLGGVGYPIRYTARAKHLAPPILGGPPEANPIWVHGVDDVLTDKWVGQTETDRVAIGTLPPDEWLLVEVWDQS